MQLETLKELLRIYSHLPTGVIVFKNGALYFINDHLRKVLSLGDLPPVKSLEVIGGILELPLQETKLLDFFLENPYFVYKQKRILITAKKYEHYDIFVFTYIHEAMMEHFGIASQTHDIEPIDAAAIEAADTVTPEEHRNLLEMLDKRRKASPTGYTLYKGVPLIAENVVVQSFKETLVIRVGDKQMISAREKTAWILRFDTGECIEGVVTHTNEAKRMVFLSALRSVTHGFYQRSSIRYDTDGEVSLSLKLPHGNVELAVLELSEHALRLVTDDARVLEALSKPKTVFKPVLRFEEHTVDLSCRFLKEAGRCEGEAAVILSYSADSNDRALLQEWRNNRQLELIKEIREFTKSLS